MPQEQLLISARGTFSISNYIPCLRLETNSETLHPEIVEAKAAQRVDVNSFRQRR